MLIAKTKAESPKLKEKLEEKEA
jgi:hypothetical protein